MKLIHRPVHPFIVTQRFGENRACIALDGSQKVISCNGLKPPAGYKSLYGPNGHDALDLRASHGQEVRAAEDGFVYHIDTKERSGLDVRVEHVIDGIRFRTIYEHLMGYQVRKGQKVTCGELIGWADNTGYSSGDHLHFVLEIYAGEKWVRVDPLQHMHDSYALQILLLRDVVKYAKELLALVLDNSAHKLRS